MVLIGKLEEKRILIWPR